MSTSLTVLKNGLTVIVDEMPHVESVAYTLYVPGGIVCDAEGKVGASLILGELVSRGAGDFNSRELSDQFDSNGITHGEGAGAERYGFRGACLADKLPKALELVASIILKPHLSADEIPDIASVLLQDIASLQDSPSRWVMNELTNDYFPAPYNRPGHGTVAGIEGSSVGSLQALYQEQFGPGGAVLSLAGKLTEKEGVALAQKYLGNWTGKGVKLPPVSAFPSRNTRHVQHEAAQLQMAFAFPSAPFGDPDFYIAKVASVVLSGGMFGRLFVEVREKRGLCYTVNARHGSTKQYGYVQAYAGTTPERAHETLAVMVEEFKRLSGTITPEELLRAKANLKASLVLDEESSGARASANAADWWLGGRVRSLEEILSAVNAVTVEAIDRYLQRFPVLPFAMVTLGSREIKYVTG